jgi:hypothetical protein
MNIFTLPKNRFSILALGIASALSVTPALSAEVDTSGWACEFCPFESGHRAEYELGATQVSDDSAYFGDASGYDEEGTYLNVDGKGSYHNDGYQIRWTIEDFGLDSRFAEVSGGRYHDTFLTQRTRYSNKCRQIRLPCPPVG